MTQLPRRTLLAAAASLASASLPRNSRAASKLPDLGRLSLSTPGAELPPFSFTLADGAGRNIADYAGHGVVLNFWATWCIPCKAEMPALDQLAAAVKADGIVVLPLSSDRAGASAVEAYYLKWDLRHLPVLLDTSGTAARALGTRGIPTTVLIDPSGLERGRLEGAADWSSPAAVAEIRKLIGHAA